MSITFYTNPMSRGQIVRWALHEVDADYEHRIVGYGDEMRGDYKRAVNPMAKVPAIDHDGRIVTECAGICAYLADVFSDADLGPRDDERADYYRWMFFAAGPVEAAVTNRSMGFDVVDPEKQGMVGYGSYDRMVETLDGFLAKSEYVCGDRFTMADVYLGAQVIWGTQFETLPKHDSLLAYAERLTARDAYRAAKAIDAELMEKMGSA
ncbi:glutathione S-transferase family protein [Sphingomicrobium sp. XHP0239]|uniref:glutathione S-transferase family protein n=1 Tax=Sphingomicrobium maritimum TaxID=3133972 RepID=UPI0031CC5650